MKIKQSKARIAFNAVNYIILSLITLTCIFPILHILAMSLSSSAAAAAGKVGFWPVDFSLEAYQYLMRKDDFFKSVGISGLRVLVGSVVNMTMLVITAYPLSKNSINFRWRNVYMVYFAITMFISGGLIPTYMVLKELNLLDSFWVLILPGAVSIWNVIILMNFFRGIPRALEEAAAMDGASHWRILFQIFLPMSLPSLASLLLFTMIGHWNAWFDGMMYMNTPENYPMATYLATQILNNNKNISNMTPEQLATLVSLNEKTMRSAQLFLSIVPILIVYPFLQRFFIKGIVVGSVKE
ncbi:MAG TPA: carbohydrate ABC transporter permease [Candidatus Merdivicinus excrementipullorum]|uniref:Carbohydrate ABC transporter permease n=1 Tax=Candidatus Merdivicinus excrementipullorum TaxID=2840867 RepID=A0A9D1FJY6_9FIRM|nr:carbohydrate ABC transporter permease [Candidatus Merdivicinus excrementipullorum]